MSTKKKILISVFIIVFILIFYLIQGMTMGSFGIRPVTAGCIGIKIKSLKANKALPEGDVEFNFPFKFRYLIVQNNHLEEEKFKYCLGQDVWMGE